MMTIFRATTIDAMPNRTSEIENAPKQLDRLAAQRQLYSDAKTIQAWQMISGVGGAVICSFVTLIAPAFRAYAALYGMVLTILDIAVLNPWQQLLKAGAAKIQELFDCDVLEVPWQKLKAGRQRDPENIAAASTRYRQRDADYSLLRNWYPPEVDKLPIQIGRVVCQRASCWWDGELRRRYALWIYSVLGSLSALVLLLGLLGGLTLEKFILAVLAPLMPAITLGLRQAREHREAAERADRLKEAPEDLWEMALQGATADELTKRSRQLQDEIYEHRRRSPLIFDWIYLRLRNAHEDQMNKGAQALVDEAMQALAVRQRSAETGGER